METIIEKLTSLLEAKFEAEEYVDCFVVEITISKSAKVQVFIDCDRGVDLAKCQRISRYLEAYLDEDLPLGERYTLEVSSPGIDRPLIARQFEKNIGRRVKVILKSGDKIKGKFISFDDACLKVEIEKAKKQVELKQLNLEEIEKIKVIVSF